MKKSIVILLSFLGLVFLVGCTNIPNYPDPKIDPNVLKKDGSSQSCNITSLSEEEKKLEGMVSVSKIKAHNMSMLADENYYKNVARKNNNNTILDLFESSYFVKQIKDSNESILIVEGIPFQRVVRNNKDGNDVYTANYKGSKLILIDDTKLSLSTKTIYNDTKFKNEKVSKIVQLQCSNVYSKNTKNNPLLEEFLLK